MIDKIEHYADELGERYIAKFTEKIAVERNKEMEDAIFVTIQGIADENGFETKIKLNEKAILAALEKQIPKKPVIPFDSINREYECPKCPHRVYKTQQYCDKCGQALDWGEQG